MLEKNDQKRQTSKSRSEACFQKKIERDRVTAEKG